LVSQKSLVDHKSVDSRRPSSKELAHAAAIQEPDKAALVHDIQSAVEIQRLVASEKYRAKDSQKVERRAS